jgi:hypothetical protein
MGLLIGFLLLSRTRGAPAVLDLANHGPTVLPHCLIASCSAFVVSKTSRLRGHPGRHIVGLELAPVRKLRPHRAYVIERRALRIACRTRALAIATIIIGLVTYFALLLVLSVLLGIGESVTSACNAEHRYNFPTENSGIQQSPADLQG